MEDVTPDMIQRLRQEFADRVQAKQPDFCPQDLERVKTSNVWLTRWLAHAENDMETATTLLFECCQWRKEFGTNELDESKIPSQIFEKGTLFIRGKDNWGKKLLIFKAKHHSKGAEQIENLQKFIVYFFERIERETDGDQISIIFDMKDTGWNNMDMDFVRYLITLLKTYYPFFVNYLVIFEMPWLLNAAWKIIKGWLPPKFVDRVKFLDKKTLKDYISVENQLTEWGGTDDYKYKFEVENRQKRTRASNGIAPEVKARKTFSKVQFSGSDQRDFQAEHSISPPASPMQHSIESPFHASSSHSLVEVDSSVSFQSNENEDYVATLRVRNIDPQGAKVIFKIKTTSPDKYRVKPTIGIADSNRTGEVVITTHAGVTAGSMLRDRFQLLVARVPPDVQLGGYESPDSQSSHSNFQQLNNIFKRIISAEGAVVETYRIGLKVEARSGDVGTTTGGSGGTVSMNEERMKKGLDDLEKKISESVTTKVDPKLAKLQKLIYIILGLTVFMSLMIFIIWYKMPSSSCCSALDAIVSSPPTHPIEATWTRDIPATGDANEPSCHK